MAVATSLPTLEKRERVMTPNQLAWRRFRRNKLAMVGLGMVLAFAFIFFFADFIMPMDPSYQNLEDKIYLAPMSVATAGQYKGQTYILGTDDLGRDVLSRLMIGTRVSLSVGFVSQFVVLLIGLPLGLLAGYYGGVADFIVMRFGEVMNSFPDLLFLIILVSIFEQRSVWLIFIVLGLTSWVTMSRVVRGQVLQIKQMDYVTGARSVGVRTGGIMGKHILPNVLSPIIVLVTLGLPGAILAEATLSFLGIGVEPGTITWGTMVTNGQGILQSKPYVALVPALTIAVLALAFTFIGDGVRDAFDPKGK